MNTTQVNLESPACQELPELHLWGEVLLLAIYDSRCQSSQGKPHDKRRVQRSARAWIRSKSEDPGSFKWCCEMLGIDPQAVQSKFCYSTPTYRHPSKKDTNYADPNSQTTD
jgi:hypothetical protein